MMNDTVTSGVVFCWDQKERAAESRRRSGDGWAGQGIRARQILKYDEGLPRSRFGETARTTIADEMSVSFQISFVNKQTAGRRLSCL